MSGPDANEHTERLRQEAARLRRQAAELASSVAATEEDADTLEEVAKHRPTATGAVQRLACTTMESTDYLPRSVSRRTRR